MPTLTWKHGGGLVPPPPPEETDAAEETATPTTESKPGPAPAKAAVKPAGEAPAADKPDGETEPTIRTTSRGE